MTVAVVVMVCAAGDADGANRIRSFTSSRGRLHQGSRDTILLRCSMLLDPGI
jgi:hypothetical protein